MLDVDELVLVMPLLQCCVSLTRALLDSGWAGWVQQRDGRQVKVGVGVVPNCCCRTGGAGAIGALAGVGIGIGDDVGGAHAIHGAGAVPGAGVGLLAGRLGLYCGLCRLF